MKKIVFVLIFLISSLTQGMSLEVSDVEKILRNNNVRITINELVNKTDRDIEIFSDSGQLLVSVPSRSTKLWQQPINEFVMTFPAGGKGRFIAVSREFMIKNWHTSSGGKSDFKVVITIDNNHLVQLVADITEYGSVTSLLKTSSAGLFDDCFIDIRFENSIEESTLMIYRAPYLRKVGKTV